MTLPLTINETPAAGTQVKSATNLDLQTAVVEGHHGSLVDHYPLEEAVEIAGTFVSDYPGVDSTGASGSIRLNLKYPVGTTITEIVVTVSQQAATPITVKSHKHGHDDLSSVDIETNAGNATTGLKDLTLVTDFRLIADAVYSLEVASTEADDTFYSAKVTYYKDQ